MSSPKVAALALALAALLPTCTSALALHNRSAHQPVDAPFGTLMFTGYVYQSTDCSGDAEFLEYYADDVWDIGCWDIAGNSVHLGWPACGHFSGTATTHSEGGCGGSSSSVLTGSDICQSNLPFNAVQWKCNHPGPH